MHHTAVRDRALDGYRKPHSKLFEVGEVFSTKAARAALPYDELMDRLYSHAFGNWGCVSYEDWLANDRAVQAGEWILSAFPIDVAERCRGYGKNSVWIATNPERTGTLVLLPSEGISLNVPAPAVARRLRRLLADMGFGRCSGA